jgi:amidase
MVSARATVRRVPADGLGEDLGALDATAQAELVRAGDVTALELVDAAITRIEKVNSELNAVIHPLFDKARDATARSSGDDAPFSGVPIVLKDLDGSSAGDPLHLGNAALRDAGHVADHDTYLVAKLRAAGCIPVGKTNTPELGLLPTAEPKAYGPTRNPWNTEHSPGGSSGGSAAAVASGMVPVGHAGDGGGSIRIPASACGLFGLKPSRGRVSMGPDLGEAWAGLVARHVVTRSVRDSAAILDAIAGAMPGDPYAAAPPARPYVHEVGTDPGRLRIGLRTRAPGDLAATDDECVAAAEDAARLLESLGHHIEVSAPAAFDDLELLVFFSTVMTVGVVADVEELGRILGREVTPADVERLTWAQYEQGRAASAIDYLRAVNGAHAWTRRMAEWWAPPTLGGQAFDLLLTPTMAEPPVLLGEIDPDAEEPFEALGRATPFAVYTAPFNVTGQPAMSVPLSWEASRNLPIGVQLVAAHGREDVLFQVAAQLEAARPWHDRRPPVHA